MSLEELASRYEKLDSQLAEQYYNQYAGLTYNREQMKKLAQQLTEISKEFLEKFSKPRSMYLASIGTIAEAERLEVELDFHDKRMEKISTEKHRIDGKKVNWGNWRQFNSQTDDAQKRKEVFDEFIAKAPTISHLVEKRMNISKEVYKRYDLTPLDSYLELEQTSYDELSNLLQKLGDGAKQTFLAAASHFAPQVLRKTTTEYYDDYYTWRGRVYKPLNKYLEGKKPLNEIRRFLTSLRFDTSTIKVDDEDRPNKSPSASCWGIQVPNDIRILFRKVSPFTDFGSVFHEFGHGIHGKSANPEDSVWKRYVVPRSVAETFSILIESVTENPLFLRQDLKLEETAIKEIVDRVRFMNLAFLTFYAANSIMKMEFWKNRYTIEQAAKRWQELTKRFFIETPGNYWILHHVMPNYDMYSPSYVIAAVRVATMKEKLAHDFGETWWRKPEAGEFIRQLAQTRGNFDIKTWKLNPDAYLDEQKFLSFLK
ncbi:MAG: M3 family metallopeptidase [Candidatus Bathyarchaeota archaeon]|nr:M3 family metallopeptidase [Candidatus Bathyarchaeota archaeon]MDH5495323.1 M3 family metallopeptidase [Candidatus Bathyarchaeota archaeon]